MSMSAQEVYAKTVRPLPPTERLRLAALILNELLGRATPEGPVDVSDVWTAEDRKDLAAFSLQYAATVYPEDEDLVG
jgi:hypothetical protein